MKEIFISSMHASSNSSKTVHEALLGSNMTLKLPLITGAREEKAVTVLVRLGLTLTHFLWKFSSVLTTEGCSSRSNLSIQLWMYWFSSSHRYSCCFLYGQRKKNIIEYWTYAINRDDVTHLWALYATMR